MDKIAELQAKVDQLMLGVRQIIEACESHAEFSHHVANMMSMVIEKSMDEDTAELAGTGSVAMMVLATACRAVANAHKERADWSATAALHEYMRVGAEIRGSLFGVAKIAARHVALVEAAQAQIEQLAKAGKLPESGAAVFSLGQ